MYNSIWVCRPVDNFCIGKIFTAKLDSFRGFRTYHFRPYLEGISEPPFIVNLIQGEILSLLLDSEIDEIDWTNFVVKPLEGPLQKPQLVILLVPFLSFSPSRANAEAIDLIPMVMPRKKIAILGPFLSHSPPSPFSVMQLPCRSLYIYTCTYRLLYYSFHVCINYIYACDASLSLCVYIYIQNIFLEE